MLYQWGNRHMAILPYKTNMQSQTLEDFMRSGRGPLMLSLCIFCNRHAIVSQAPGSHAP